eukprot:scaffold14574_cov120-Isochrysis_galbana.AAC.13
MLSEERGLYDAETVSMSVPFAIIEAPQARSSLARLLGPLAPLLLRGMHSTSRSARAAAASGPLAPAPAPSSQVAQFQFRRFRSVELCAVCNAAVAVSTSVLANNNQQRFMLIYCSYFLDFMPSTNSASSKYSKKKLVKP